MLGRKSDDELYSPQWFLDWLPPIDLDPCFSPFSNVRPANYFNFDEHGDSFALDWALPGIRTIFINPPYSDIQRWFAKMADSAVGDIVVIGLVQAKPGETAWVRDVWPRAQVVGVLPGRLKFDRPLKIKSQSGTFNSAVPLWGSPERCAEVMRHIDQRAAGHKHAPIWVAPIGRHASFAS